MPSVDLPRAPELHLWSGCPDSNRGPPAPKAGALTKLRHIPPEPKSSLPDVGAASHRCVRLARAGGNCGRRHNIPATRVDVTWRRDHREPGTLHLAAKPPRGRSSMAEPQPSKLVMRVRFPSPAPTRNPRSEDRSALSRAPSQGRYSPVVPLACH